jgi:uncharacterized protein
LIDIKNAVGRSPLGEAEAAGWDEGAKWMVEVMLLDDGNDARDAVEEDSMEMGEQDADVVPGGVARTPATAVEPEVEGGSSPRS